MQITKLTKRLMFQIKKWKTPYKQLIKQIILLARLTIQGKLTIEWIVLMTHIYLKLLRNV